MSIIFTGIHVWSCSTSGDVCVWDPPASSGEYVLLYQWKPLGTTTVGPSCMQFISSTSSVAAAPEAVWLGSGAEGTISVWDATTYGCVATITDEALLECSHIVHKENHVWVSGKGGKVSILDKDTLCLLGTFEAHNCSISSMAVINTAAQTKEIWTASNLGEMTMWSMQTLSDLQKLSTSNTHVTRVLDMVSFGRLGQLFSLSFDGRLMKWNTESKQAVEEVSEDLKWPVALAATADGRVWTICDRDIQVWTCFWQK
jgi:WD40 repeat protein